MKQLELPQVAGTRSLNEVLASLGFTTRPAAGIYQKDILKGGVVKFSGDADAVWKWLRASGQVLQ